jgi:hypothetical protein
MKLETILQRRRDSGQLPRFVAPAGTEPPEQLKSPAGDPPPRRYVGKNHEGGGGVR